MYMIEYVYWFRIKHTWSNLWVFFFVFFLILILNSMLFFDFFSINFFPILGSGIKEIKNTEKFTIVFFILRSRLGCLTFNKLDGIPMYIIEYVYWFRITHTNSKFHLFLLIVIFSLFIFFLQFLAVVTLRDQKHREIHLRALYSINNVIKYNIFDLWYL